MKTKLTCNSSKPNFLFGKCKTTEYNRLEYKICIKLVIEEVYSTTCIEKFAYKIYFLKTQRKKSNSDLRFFSQFSTNEFLRLTETNQEFQISGNKNIDQEVHLEK